MSGTPPLVALSHMEEVVSMLQEELEATNREVMMLTLELEQRVAERTGELSRANEELRKEIAERLRAGQEVIQLNKDLAQRAGLLAAANEELEAFSSSVSHDLRNPLTRVLGYAALLKDSAGLVLKEKEQQYIDRMSDAGKQMVALIDDLLRFSHAAHVELAWTKVDLNDLVVKLLSELELETRGRNIVWKRPELPMVCADLGLIKQVFVNLISNALKYARPRSPAEIEISAFRSNGDEWIFCVRDNGVGFDQGQVNKLFSAFQRLHRKDEFEGTGMGLANVRRIILRHGGRVWAEVKPNVGAEFYFSLPVRD
jgi:signal transduction histidine kinase